MTGPLHQVAPHPAGLAAGDEEALLIRLLQPALGEAEAHRTVRALVERFGGVGAGLAAPEAELVRLMGEAGAPCVARLRDLYALVLAVVRRKAVSRPILGSRIALKRYLATALAAEPREQFRVLYLDSRNGLIREEINGVGTRDHAPVYPREVVRRALELSATALILVHNHPSGSVTPSGQDIEMTNAIVTGAAVFSIAVHDHLVVGHRRVFSFHDAGLIGPGSASHRLGPWPAKLAGPRSPRRERSGSRPGPPSACLHSP